MRQFKPTKLLLYKRCKEIIKSLRFPVPKEVDQKEVDGANDILYRLMCTESIHAMAIILKKKDSDIYNAIDLVLTIDLPDCTTRKQVKECLKQHFNPD